ncbi:MAG: CPBP family intramembrane metalloprotease [Candidatus Marinimicrobia bacterium]|jgi:hypothetical protein|nr:CPBP family intramembrane metalloprotease [Candidatus Neomarinimicrobiota bacterium]MBT3683611.1 CPBP family intramembrane metalloprotease [Candidatus Neomarinimicrobiota bacterium]MBT3760390.1 CPBP family intramembrane metalloprotease [Candidatus Neomarinimicrobiota bacterium]MBT3896532.1 CPBP family intramembrane metalloprotease [Candidatus Neomarinimicrobiota bacterium]MBT4173554.1 CPBP family intramembrane metalloprotease [Candidatus Neomarinimicrobiota bacterium]
MIKIFLSSIEHNIEEKKAYRWKVAISLFIVFVSCSLANIIFVREVTRLKLESGEINKMLSKPIIDHILSTGINSLIIGAFLIYIGLWVSSKANLGAPVLARFFSNRPVSELINWKPILSSVTLAIVIATALLGLFELHKWLYPVLAFQERPSKIYYVIVSFVAGTNEEIIYRLCLMSVLIATIQYFKKLDKPTDKIVWTGILFAALIFGLMHFPITSNFFKLTPFTIAVTMIGNLITGTTFGWIFWKRGLLVAIVSHIAFDIVFHVIGSPFG